jgi:hypothetical protein
MSVVFSDISNRMFPTMPELKRKPEYYVITSIVHGSILQQGKKAKTRTETLITKHVAFIRSNIHVHHDLGISTISNVIQELSAKHHDRLESTSIH